MSILNFGSLNLDYVYAVDHFVQPGETLASRSRSVKPGGKGLNQTVAMLRAGARVFHAGCIGEGGDMLRQLLEQEGADTRFLQSVPEMQGHTVIQVTPEGENCILLCGGSNRCITEKHISRTIAQFSRGDWLVLQNEINNLPLLVEIAHDRGMKIVLNPSPCEESLRAVDFRKLSWLFVNEIEAKQITGETDPVRIWGRIRLSWPWLSLLLTLGAQGSIAFLPGGQKCGQPAFPVKAVDTTAAGDTYTGYFLAGYAEGLPLRACMERAAKAAAISVTRPGAAESIPRAEELDTWHP